MKNSKKERFNIVNFKEVNFEYRDIRWALDLQDIDPDQVVFSINVELEILGLNRLELFLHTQFFYEIENELTSIMHIDFVSEIWLNHSKDIENLNLKENPTISLKIVEKTLKQLVSDVGGYYLAKRRSNYDFLMLPEIDIKKILSNKECVKDKFYHLNQSL